MSLNNENLNGYSKESNGKLNWLRAAVLGANDGIVSISGLVVGVASATDSKTTIATAGVAGVIAGAISMAAGEYVSVSTQRDTERAFIEQERIELANNPEEELVELAQIYESRGMSKATALQAAKELTNQNALAAHLESQFGISEENLTSPIQAAIASALSFLVGAAIPLIAILVPPADYRVPVTFVAVIAALALTGTLSARAGGANAKKATIRVVTWGIVAMSVTYVIGKLFGIAAV